MTRFFSFLTLPLIIFVSSCDSANETPPPFKEFEFYYNNTWTSAFSMKFTQTDTLYIRQYFVANRNQEGDSGLKSNTSYFTIFNINQSVEFNNLIRRINFSSYNSSYIDSGLQDGTMMKFFLITDSITKPIVIYGDQAPSELLQLGVWIAEMKRHMQLIHIDTIIPFLHKELPEPAIDMKKFTPPTI